MTPPREDHPPSDERYEKKKATFSITRDPRREAEDAQSKWWVGRSEVASGLVAFSFAWYFERSYLAFGDGLSFR